MNTNLQNKLSQFEPAPPEGVWDRITQALDAEENLPHRLYDYQEQPPVLVWNAIEAALNETSEPVKTIPFTTRFKKPLRYVAAASIIAVLLISSTLFLKRTEAGSIQAGSNTTVPVK